MKVVIFPFFLTAPFLGLVLPSLSIAKHDSSLRRLGKRDIQGKVKTDAYNATGHAFGDNVHQKQDGTKYVFMHHVFIHSNLVIDFLTRSKDTYEYTRDSWATDLKQIQAKDIDAVALNVGRDSWQRSRIEDAYIVAATVGMSVFISFDYTSFDCSVDNTIQWVDSFKGLPAQFKVNGRPMISSYSGECLGPDGWQTIRAKTGGFLMPFIYGTDDQQFKKGSSYGFLDSWYCWGCAWPQGNYDKTTGDDHYYMDIFKNRYATTVSSWLYTHYNYKNFYLRGDEWLLITRWEQLISMRDQLTFVEMVTWNDYGESNYFGPGPSSSDLQPYGTTWADGFPHNGFFDLSAYYIAAFKTGTYPQITKDTIYFWLRPHPAGINANKDPLPKPEGWDWTSDTLWAAVFCSSTCNVTLQVGAYSQDFNNLPHGVNKISIPLKALGFVTVKMSKNGQQVINHTPSDFQYRDSIDHYNYNAYVGSASANN
ncbi:glycosyl hydrolase family 71-domain-containing protein [Lentinula aff. lateritia]|uniref:Glycosyl hydrolase family 71-domain-containing protein n=1 Tax=Lentinula aff. lateritia TaxID=2804960 RepID=A0ACC1U8M7_9AGAR|nr:glycosyl hydrolase family 71-domain-containing protein [Lentinula aff. lateritia]